MDIKDFIKPPIDFLQVKDIEEDSSVFIIGESKIIYNENFKSEKLRIPVIFNKKEYNFDASKTNARKITEILGDDTKLWISNELILGKIDMEIKGKNKKIIDVKKIEK